MVFVLECLGVVIEFLGSRLCFGRINVIHFTNCLDEGFQMGLLLAIIIVEQWQDFLWVLGLMNV